MTLQKDFDIERVLLKPLMAHLSTSARGEPRDSPVWFLWEDSALWIFGREEDSFIKRLRKEPRCAIGVVDFDLEKGVLLHVGIRGKAKQIGHIDKAKLNRFLTKYLGQDQKAWNEWFLANIVEPLDVIVGVEPQTIVSKDVSFFKTGPSLSRVDE